MNLLNTLIHAADEEQLSLRPLPEHAAAGQEEHLRRHYALLLAAVLTAQPAVSEPQTRLLRLLLDALKLGDIRGPLFEQARELLPDQLLEAARLIRDAGFAHHLVVDVLVLLRLDAPLGDEVTRVAGELAAFLGLDESALAKRARDAVEILGLNSPTGTQSEREDPGAEDAAHASPLLAELWPGLLSQPLTADALRAGLQGGLWLLDANLDVDFPWQANDAALVFRNGATLYTFANKGDVKLIDCRLSNVALDFHGEGSVLLERCNWQGDYEQSASRTALRSMGLPLKVNACEFSTWHARAIEVLNADLALADSRFTRCGHSGLDGGAVWHSGRIERIMKSHFDHCLARRGGAIWVQGRDTKIDQCSFIACESLALQDKMAGDVAVYWGDDNNMEAISNSFFRKTSLYIGLTGIYSRCYVVSSNFQEGNIYYKGSPYKLNDEHCTLDSGSRIEVKDWS